MLGAVSEHSLPHTAPAGSASGTPPTLSSSRALLEKRHHGAVLTALFGERHRVLVDDGDRQQNTGAAADCAGHIRNDRQQTHQHPTESGRGGNVAVQLFDQRRVSVALDGHVLIAQLLGDVARALARHLDVEVRHHRAGAQHERDVEQGVQRVAGCLGQLGEKVQVAHQGGLQNDRRVAGVEQLDGIGGRLPTHLVRLDRQVDAEALQIGQLRSIERLVQRSHLVPARQQQVKQRQDGALELGAAADVDGGRGERRPHDRLRDIGGDEQTDARSHPVALLQQLVQQHHHQTGAEQLQHQERGVVVSQRGHRAVHARVDVDERFKERKHDAGQFLGRLEKRAVGLVGRVHLDDTRAHQQLHDHAGGDDGRKSQLHDGAARAGA
eukprot:ctg_177.g82